MNCQQQKWCNGIAKRFPTTVMKMVEKIIVVRIGLEQILWLCLRHGSNTAHKQNGTFACGFFLVYE